MSVLAASPIHAETAAVVAEDATLLQLVPVGAVVEKLATGFGFTEGPAWHPGYQCLIFSDIPASRLYLYDPAARGDALRIYQPSGGGAAPATRQRFKNSDTVQVFREESEAANGNFIVQGRLYTCEQKTRCVTCTDAEGVKKELPIVGEHPRFSSPNDVVVKKDGSVWFTDPTYGLGKRPKEQTANNVFRFDPVTSALHVVADDFHQPNGLCFSPDESRLYIADSDSPHHVRVFTVNPDNTLQDGRVFCVINPGVPDGMRCDRAGNLFSTAGDGVHIFSPAGVRLGKILVPETPANLCFGGANGDELYITARTSLYRVKLLTTGANR